jgi:hypothetical protein
VLSNSFEEAQSIAHDGTDVFFSHGDLLVSDKSASRWLEPARNPDTPILQNGGGFNAGAIRE